VGKIVRLQSGESYMLTDKMDGKMRGMWSLNTSPSLNPFCLEMRRDKENICSHCYTRVSESRWKGCKKAWQQNYKILTTHRLIDEEIPVISQVSLFRFQAHGDLGNRIHYENMIAMAERNQNVMFALWTKHLDVIYSGRGIIHLPNVVYIYSTAKMNDLKPLLPTGFHKAFTVYSRPFLREHSEIQINCAKSCLECQLCYQHNDIVLINEKIKAPANKD